MKTKTVIAFAIVALWGGVSTYSRPVVAATRSSEVDYSPWLDDGCKDIPSPFVSSVVKPSRPEALQNLKGTDVVELSDTQAAHYLGETLTGQSLAVLHIDRAIADLKSQRRDALVFQKGAWSVDDERRLARLMKIKASGDARRLKPFLVRALMGFETTGGFVARLCNNDLYVKHGSLGHSTPPPTPAAVIVMLRQRPVHVTADFTIAE